MAIRAHGLHHRRGFALMDAIVGGIMLGIGLAAILSVASRSVALRTEGQRQIVAAWLLDELLAMVLVEGPVAYPQLYATQGRFDFPFEDFEYDLDIDDLGLQEPFRVTATVRWAQGVRSRQAHAQTYIAERRGDAMEDLERRAPLEPIDRVLRYFDDEEE